LVFDALRERRARSGSAPRAASAWLDRDGRLHDLLLVEVHEAELVGTDLMDVDPVEAGRRKGLDRLEVP
jgi:hypothetical protein